MSRYGWKGKPWIEHERQECILSNNRTSSFVCYTSDQWGSTANLKMADVAYLRCGPILNGQIQGG